MCPALAQSAPVEIESPKNSYENPHVLQAAPEKDRARNIPMGGEGY